MGKNDKPTDTQAGQGSNNPSTPATAPTSTTRSAKDTKKQPQNTRKASSSNTTPTNIPERPKKKAPASGQNPPAKPQARSTKLGAFEPHRGVPSTTVGGADEWQPYDPNSRQFIMLADAYNLGMRLLERSDATAKLVHLGHLCVKDWKKTAADTGYHWSGDESKMNEYVRHFLEKYRSETTRVSVSARPLGDAYAESEYDIGYVLPDLFKLNPKTLTNVVIDNELFEKVMQNDARRAKLFGPEAQKNATDLKAFAQARRDCADLSLIYQVLLGSIMFHEFAHCFVYYLGMTGEPNTPPDATILEVPTDVGESGSWLELQILGGVMGIKEGVLYLIDGQDVGREVDLTRLKNFVGNTEGFDLRNGLPLKAKGKECTRQRGIFRAIKKQSKAYDVYLGRDSDGFTIYTAAPQVVVPAA